MRLTLDHVILRAADPAAAPERPGGSVGIEVVTADVPAGLHGYGLAFTADVPLEAASSELRRAGLKTSPEVVGDDGTARVHVHGLLPDPTAIPTFNRSHDAKQRVTESLAMAIARIPFVARRIAQRTGSSLVVVVGRPAGNGSGPAVTTVEVGTGGHDWSAMPLAPGPLVLDPDGPAGVRRIGFADGTELTCG